MHKLTQEEQELLDAYERGEWQSVPHLDAEKQRYREYATATLTQIEKQAYTCKRDSIIH